MSNFAALNTYLKPLSHLLEDSTISEILINTPQVVWIEKEGLFEKIEIETLTFNHLMGLANLIARFTEQRFSEKEPLLSAHLPSGHRVQIILPPATKAHHLIISIRKQTISDLNLEQYEALGVFKDTKTSSLILRAHLTGTKKESMLQEAYRAKDYVSFLKYAVKAKKNILVSGATSTGKTTFLNACLKEIPMHEHIITLEDVPEIKMKHPLHTALFISKGSQGLSRVTLQDLLQASLRLRPDRIILGELRGEEAADFINATATGHDGALSSLHASNPWMALMRLTHMVKLSRIQLPRKAILADLTQLIDIIVQLERRFENNRYIRAVSEIYYADAIT